MARALPLSYRDALASQQLPTAGAVAENFVPIEDLLADEPPIVPSTTAAERVMQSSGDLPHQAPAPKATLEEILSNRANQIQQRAEKQAAIQTALANIQADTQRAFAPIFGTPVDPSANAGGRALAQIPLQSAQRQQENLLREYAAAKEQEKLGLENQRSGAVREYLKSRYGVDAPEGMTTADLSQIASQESLSERARQSDLSDLERVRLVEEMRTNRKRVKDGSGLRGNVSGTDLEAMADSLGLTGPARASYVTSPKFRQQINMAAAKQQIKPDTMSATEIVALKNLGKNYSDLLPISSQIDRVSDKVLSYKDIPGVGGVSGVITNLPGGSLAMAAGSMLGNNVAREAQTVRQELDELRDLVQRARTGAAINASEEKFYLGLLGKGLTGSDELLRNAVERIRREVGAKVQNAVAATPRHIVDLYNKNAQSAGASDVPAVGADVSNNVVSREYEEDDQGNVYTVETYTDGTTKEFRGVRR